MKNRAPKYRIFKQSLLYLVLLFTFSCADFDAIINPNDINLFSDKIENANLKKYSEEALDLPPLVEYIIDFENPMSVKYSNHLKKLSNYTKIPYNTVNIKAWNANQKIEETTRVLCVYETKKLNDESVNTILKFVSDGGTLFLPFACEDKRFGYMLGMKSSAEYATDVTSFGLYFAEPFIPTLTGTEARTNIIHFGMSGENFDYSKIKVYATAINNKSYPTILDNRVGKGKVVNLNTTFEFEKMDRGLLFSAMMMGLEGIPYPIANTNTIFLDDFPAPLYDAKEEPIKSEMNMSISDFVQKAWWPDMKTLAKKYQISYTAIPAFDYNVKTNPPFLFSQWDNKKISQNNTTEPLSSWLMRDCLKNGHELGFHGYNHVSLLKRDWKKPEFIVTSLEGVQKKWKVSNFGDLPVSYVPPSNYIDQMGIRKLTEGLPSIQFLCSLYLGKTYEGGNREYDFDPYQHNLFDYPRISSGFEINDDSKYNIQSLYLYTGIWNHFVHPDDVYQIPSPFNKSAGDFELRNSRGLGWKTTKGKKGGLYHKLDNYLQEFTNAFPQSRFLNAKKGGMITYNWRASRFDHNAMNGYYFVEKLNPTNSGITSQYWFMYGTDENAESIEAQLKTISIIYSKTKYLDGYLYSIYTRDPEIKIKDYREYRENELKFMFSKVNNEYYTFLAKVSEFEKGNDIVDNYDDNLETEKRVLEKRMLSETAIDYETWNKYAEFLSWEEKGVEVWELLDKHCLKYPTKNNVLYSEELAKNIGYPNDLAMEKWINAQLLVNPKDKDLLNNYVANYNTAENAIKIKEALLALLSIDTGKESLYNYIQHLLWYEPKSAVVEVDKIEPSLEYKALATNITWLYANEKMYQKAYDWSQYSDEIEVSNKMEWLYELKQYESLINEYRTYITENPLDYKTKALMSSYYQGMGKFKEAWVLASELPESREKEALRKALNEDVVYQEDFVQQDLLTNYPELFLNNISKSLTKTNRLKYGNFIESENQLQTNQDRRAALTTRHSYNFYDKKKNSHRIAATFSEFYPLIRSTVDTIGSPQGFENASTTENLGISLDNIFRNVYGLEYRFKNPFSFDKLQYWSRVRVEMDNFDKVYMQFGLGLNKSFNKNFSSFETNLFPVETAPGHAKEIYQVRTNLYQSVYFASVINASVALESNYYSKSNFNSDFITDNNIDGSATLKVGWDRGNPKMSKFVPFLETAYQLGSADLSDGYPYWMLKERLFGGGGINYSYGLEASDFKATIEATYFFDDYADVFQRLSGNLSYRIKNYFSITGSFELFNQDKFYSNTLNVGLKYNFK
jgi:hypothetical protein